MIFQSGIYYIGDPGAVLPNDDLRMLASSLILNVLTTGTNRIISADKTKDNKIPCNFYWYAKTPNRCGTLYDQEGNGWGFDWGCFGVVPWEWVENQSSYEAHKLEFTEPFECSCTDNSITIGHLHFTFEPK